LQLQQAAFKQHFVVYSYNKMLFVVAAIIFKF